MASVIPKLKMTESVFLFIVVPSQCGSIKADQQFVYCDFSQLDDAEFGSIVLRESILMAFLSRAIGWHIQQWNKGCS